MGRIIVGTAVVVLVLSSYACALINPNFTPIDLVDDADTVLLLKLAAPDAKDRVTAEIKRVIKGVKVIGYDGFVGLVEEQEVAPWL